MLSSTGFPGKCAFLVLAQSENNFTHFCVSNTVFSGMYPHLKLSKSSSSKLKLKAHLDFGGQSFIESCSLFAFPCFSLWHATEFKKMCFLGRISCDKLVTTRHCRRVVASSYYSAFCAFLLLPHLYLT